MMIRHIFTDLGRLITWDTQLGRLSCMTPKLTWQSGCGLHDLLHKWQANKVFATALMDSHSCGWFLCTIIWLFNTELVVHTLPDSEKAVTLSVWTMSRLFFLYVTLYDFWHPAFESSMHWQKSHFQSLILSSKLSLFPIRSFRRLCSRCHSSKSWYPSLILHHHPVLSRESLPNFFKLNATIF